VTTGLFFFLRHFTISEKDARRWYVQAMLLGMLAVLFGVMPIWLTDRQVVTGMHSDRFGMPAMLGASLVVAGFINWLGISQNKQILFISLLVGLAAGQHLRTENDYRWDWVTQNRFYWQLAWRAPSIQPNTSIFAEGEFLSNMSGNAITTGIDLLYAPPQHPTYTLPYYFYSLGRDYSYRMADFLKGIPTHENNYRIYHFNGSTRAALVIDYSPDKNNCLHILRPDDAGLPNLPPYSAQALPNSNLALIQPGPSQPGYPPADIYGPQPDLPWCRIYQQAELARQTGDWQKVASLGDQAALKGFSLKNSSSNTPYEWLPFVEAYARTGHIDSASRISIDIVGKDARMNVYMCQFWNKIHDGMPRTDFSGVFTSLGCNAK